MSFSLTDVRFVDAVEVTDYVANGSFASLKENVTYKTQPDFAVLARLVDHNAGWKGDRVYVDEKAYKFLSKSSLVAGDVVIANVGANAGTVFQIPNLGTPITLGPNAVRVRPKGLNLDKDFLYYYLSSPLGQDKLQSIITGSAQPKFNKTALRSLAIRLPSVSYQRQTVDLVKALDDRITLLRETNATLEAIAQALFKSWFVDFDPVRAKQQGLAPEGMDEATAALFPDGFEESELGLVPRGWRVGAFSDICSIASGKRPPERSDSLSEQCPIPLYGGAGLMGYSSAPLFTEPKIVTGRVGTLGKVHIAYPPFWASDNVLVISPLDFSAFSFTLHWLRSIDVLKLNRGSTQPLLTQRDLGSQIGVIPSKSVVGTFEETAGHLYQLIRCNQLQAQTLSTLRDTLLPRLISGQLRLRDFPLEATP